MSKVNNCNARVHMKIQRGHDDDHSICFPFFVSSQTRGNKVNFITSNIQWLVKDVSVNCCFIIPKKATHDLAV